MDQFRNHTDTLFDPQVNSDALEILLRTWQNATSQLRQDAARGRSSELVDSIFNELESLNLASLLLAWFFVSELRALSH
jgi:hypothetical protein